jgi:hypothetical protein
MRAAAVVPLLVLAAHAARIPAAHAQERKPIEAPDGVPISFTSNDPAMRIYIARGDLPGSAPADAYARAGLVPLTLRLAPGTYTVEAESPKASAGHQRLLVEPAAPMNVEVRSGSTTVKTLGTVLLAMGIVTAVLGVVAIVSISPDDSHYNRFGIGLPLLLGGVGGAGLGFGLSALGSTELRIPHLPPGGAPRAPAATTVVPAIVLRF